MTLSQFAVLLLGLAFVLGVRSTLRLWFKYHRVARAIAPERNTIGLAFLWVASVVTIVVGFFGFVAARRLLGYENLSWTAPVETVLSIPVLFIPVILDGTFDYISRRK